MNETHLRPFFAIISVGKTRVFDFHITMIIIILCVCVLNIWLLAKVETRALPLCTQHAADK